MLPERLLQNRPIPRRISGRESLTPRPKGLGLERLAPLPFNAVTKINQLILEAPEDNTELVPRAVYIQIRYWSFKYRGDEATGWFSPRPGLRKAPAPRGLALTIPCFGHAMAPVKTARERKSGTVASGTASAGGVAPKPLSP